MRATALSRAAFFAAIAVFAVSTAFAADYPLPEQPTNRAIDTMTQASDPCDVTLSFVRPGRVVKVLVKVGDVVKAGQLLAQQDDSEEQAEYDYAQAQANDDTKVTAQVKITDQKAKVLERKKNAGDTVNVTELEEAQIEWEVAVAQTALARFEHVQDGVKLEQAKAVLDKTKLFSPIDGVVQKVMIHEGESVDNQNMRVMEVVNVDPLWIDVPVPFDLAAKIKLNDVAHVTFSDDKKNGEGSVISIAPSGESASGTRYIRVLVKNDAKRPAGERVLVSFDSDGKVADNQKP